MTVQYIKKDITTVDKGMIAHGVNCQRVMGSGVAGAIRLKWPQVYDSYMKFLPNLKGQPLLGQCDLVEIEADKLYVANCFTQNYYGRDGKKYADVAAIRESLVTALFSAYALQLPVYIPKIGCGLGGLDWDTEVRPSIEEFSQQLPNIDIFVCELV